MNKSKLLQHILATAVFAAPVFAASSANVQAATITREFSASWIDPARVNQGVILEVINGASGKELLMYWFTYDNTGRPTWVLGNGPVQANQAEFKLYTASNGSFNGAHPATISEWGNVKIDFGNCQSGSMTYNSPNGSGSMNLNRFTSLFQSACSGGVSDDLSTSRSEQTNTTFFTNTGVHPAASGKVKYEARAGRVNFSVEAEDLPVGAYDIRVGGKVRGSLNVVSVVGGTEGEIEWRSPAEPGHPLLDFDPLNQTIEILSAGRVALTTSVVGGGTTQPPVTPPGGTLPPAGVEELYQLVLEPSGNDGPELHAKYSRRSDRQEFSVELEDVAAGSYKVLLDGTEQGSVTVVSVAGGTEGEVEFRNPVEAGKLPLNFDPRGKLIEIRNASNAVAFSGTFPTTTGTVTDDNDDNDDNDDDDDNGGTVGTGGTGSNPPPTMSLSTDLRAVGPDGDANGSASYETTANEREFEVEIEDVADGSYDILVGGSKRGTVDVSDERGRTKFRDPARDGSPLLNFNPAGQTIEVAKGGVVYVRGTL